MSRRQRFPIKSSDASVAGRFLFFATKDVPPTGMKLLEAANAIAIVLALLSFVIFSVLFFARDWLEWESQEA